jgi:hypothetical protein
MAVSGLLDRRSLAERGENPDKVITRPYLGREAVSFSSILHDELRGRTAAAG